MEDKMRRIQDWRGVITAVAILTLLAGVVVQFLGDSSGTGWVLVIVGISMMGSVTALGAQKNE